MSRRRQKGTRASNISRCARSLIRRDRGAATAACPEGGRGSGAPSWLRSRPVLLVNLLGALCVLLFVASSADGAHHVFDGTTIGAPGPGPGQLSEPSGVAVNEATGVLYVVDRGNKRIERFDAATGAYLGQFDGGPSYEVIEAGVPVTEPTEEAGHGLIGPPEEFPSGAFEDPEGIAVDNGCHLREVELGHSITVGECETFDPSNGDVYVVDARTEDSEEPNPGEVIVRNHPVVDKFGPTGEYVGQITRNVMAGEPLSEFGFRFILGVAVDPRGEVWVEAENFGPGQRAGASHYDSGAHNGRINFVGTETASSTTPAPGPAFAADAEDDLFVHNTTGAAGDAIVKFDSSGNLLKAPFGGQTPTAVAVEPGTGHVYVDHAPSWEQLDPEGHEVESLAVPGTNGTGIAVDSSTAGGGTVYVADSSTDLVYVYPPEPPGPPTIGLSAVSAVTAETAGLEGEVDPHSAAGEPATTYAFEYGPCPGGLLTCAASPYIDVVSSGQISPTFEAEPVSAAIAGLEPGTTYHFRLSASNSHSVSPTRGEERTFTTQVSGSSSVLPDDRSYELVSPADKHGSILFPIAEGLIQASVSGDAISYLANGPTEGEPAGNSQAVQVLSRRAGSGVAPWLSQDIATAHSATVGIELGPGRGEYRFFSGDLSRGVVQPGGETPTALSPEATERTPYLRTDFPAGDVASPCLTACYEPLVSASNVPVGTKFGEGSLRAAGPRVVGASADASHVVLTSSAGLTQPPGGGLYEWSEGGLQPIALLPQAEGGGPAPGGVALGFANTADRSFGNARDAISADGTRVIWTEVGESGNHHLFLRDTEVGHEQTTRLDLQQGGTGNGAVAPVFQTASTDGSRIFFTDTQQLVSGASESGADLYEYDLERPLGERLTDLTPQGSGEAADALGLVAGASDDGDSIYFTANGRLTDRPNPRGETAVTGDCDGETVSGTPESQTIPQRCNLYLRRAGQTRLVAVLTGADFPDFSLHAVSGGLTSLTDRVSPDGRYLAFMSQRPLTGYDSRDAVTAKADEEVFLYDASGDSGEGSLVCASCNPTGARPHGIEYSRMNASNGGLAGGPDVWPPAARIAANVPGWTGLSQGEGFAFHQSRYLSDQGRLFFNSADALVPKDTNGTEDVYEYEPPATATESPPDDSCTTASATFTQASGGCVSLISTGTSKEESAFMDASETGNDVFFLTSSQLSARDEDTAADLYDARVGGGEIEAVNPVECAGDACQEPATPRNRATPGSLTFSGAGNVAECPKGKVKQKGKCVKKHKKKGKKKKQGKHKKSDKQKAKRAGSKSGGRP